MIVLSQLHLTASYFQVIAILDKIKNDKSQNKELLGSSPNEDDDDWDGEDPEEGIIYVEQMSPYVTLSLLCIFHMDKPFTVDRYVLIKHGITFG